MVAANCCGFHESEQRHVLIYKYDLQPVRCVLVMHGVKADVAFADFCYLARERLAGGDEGAE